MEPERGFSAAEYSWHKCRTLETTRAFVSASSAEEGSEAARVRRTQLRMEGRVRGSWVAGGGNSEDPDAGPSE